MNVEDLFGPGVLVREREYELVSLLRGHSLGSLAVPSGRLLAGDAYGLADVKPVEVPAGNHDVVFAANEMDAGHDGAGLLIRVRKGAIARWAKLRTLGVDGAAIAFADAGAKLPTDAIGSLEIPLGAARIGRSFAMARVGSDGGYPLRAGYDARDRLLALAITAKEPRKLAAWPGRGSDVPPVDATDLDACLAWARKIGGEESIVRAGKTDVAPLRAIRPIPHDLRRYYATHTPYLEGDLETFRRIVERHALGRALPIAVNGEDALVYLAGNGTLVDLYEGSTMGSCLDLRAWVLLSTIAVHDLRAR